MKTYAELFGNCWDKYNSNEKAGKVITLVSPLTVRLAKGFTRFKLALYFTIYLGGNNVGIFRYIWQYRFGWVVAKVLSALLNFSAGHVVPFSLHAFEVTLHYWFRYWIILYVSKPSMLLYVQFIYCAQKENINQSKLHLKVVNWLEDDAKLDKLSLLHVSGKVAGRYKTWNSWRENMYNKLYVHVTVV